jgi:hypothetical protein
MPIYFRSDDKPVIELDPGLEISPFALFRRLKEQQPLLLVDVREQPAGYSLRGAVREPDASWTPAAEGQVVLFDDDGTLAVERARQLQQGGYRSVRALFGGLQLYAFSLDPEVVGNETFLVQLPSG